jgi:hypothetical protein
MSTGSVEASEDWVTAAENQFAAGGGFNQLIQTGREEYQPGFSFFIYITFRESTPKPVKGFWGSIPGNWGLGIQLTKPLFFCVEECKTYLAYGLIFIGVILKRV